MALSSHPLVQTVGRYLDGLVHPGIAHAAEETPRLRSFVIFHYTVGLLALIAVPLHLVIAGPMHPLPAIALGLLAVSALVAAFVSRTGALGLGYGAISVTMGLLIGWIAAGDGGLHSPALFWLVLLPIEAALSGSRRNVLFAIATAAVVACGVAAADSLQATVAATVDLVRPGTALGIAYMTGLALRMDMLHRLETDTTRQARAEVRLMALNVGDVVTLHGANADVLTVSPGCERILRLPSAGLVGDGYFQHVHVADRPAYLKAIADAMPRDASSTVEFRLRVDEAGQQPRFVWMEMRCRSLVGEDAGAAVLGVSRDITERKRQEEELLAAREAAESASIAKSRFLANVSHELRTPLNAIIGFSELLALDVSQGDAGGRQREYVDLIRQSGTHLLHVINDILDMSKIEAGKYELRAEPFAPGELIHSTVRMMAPQASEAGVSVKVAVPANMPEIVADPRACRQILLNLVSNAIKFSDRGGHATVGARIEGRMLALFVRDDGIGISEKDIPLLGAPFVQANSGYDRRHQGSGLGLSVVKGLVGLHGGTLSIESRLGVGTCVTVALPIDGSGMNPPCDLDEARVVPLLAQEAQDTAPAARQARASA